VILRAKALPPRLLGEIFCAVIDLSAREMGDIITDLFGPSWWEYVTYRESMIDRSY